MLVWQSQQWSK